MSYLRLFTLRAIFTLVIVASGVILGAPRADAGDSPYLGEIMFVGFSFCPIGWLPADGRALDIQANTALFSLLGTTYGGNGQTTFELPDVRGQIVHPGKGGQHHMVRLQPCIAVNGIYPSRP